MNHAECRAAVAAHERSPEVAAHLEQCARCAGFAARIEAIATIAPRLAPSEPSEQLADRLVAAVRAPAAAAPATGPGAAEAGATAAGATTAAAGVLRPRRPFRRRLVHRLVGAAAAAVLVAGVGAIRSLDSGDDAPRQPRDVLLAAAERTEDRASIGVRVRARTTVEVTAPPSGTPDFAQLPPDLSAYAQRGWDGLMAGYRKAEAEFRRQLAEFERKLRELSRQWQPHRNPGPVPAFPTAPPDLPGLPGLPGLPIQPEQPERPDGVRATVDVEASGVMWFDGRVSLAGTVRPLELAASASTRFTLSAGQERAAIRAEDGAWLALDSPGGLLASLLLQGDALPRLLRAGQGSATAAGAVTLDAGAAQRYRYRTTLDGIATDVDVFVLASGDVHRVEVTASGRVGTVATWRTVVDIELAAAPDGATFATPATSGSAQSSAVLAPFGSLVADAVRRAR